jgi:hypothetical protein
MKPCERKLHTWFFNPPAEDLEDISSRPSTVGMDGLDDDDTEFGDAAFDDDAATLIAGDINFFSAERGDNREDGFMTVVTAGNSQKSRAGTSGGGSTPKYGRPTSKAAMNSFTSAVTEFLTVKDRASGAYNELYDRDQAAEVRNRC